MAKYDVEKELVALSLLDGAAAPVGAFRLVEAFKEHGIGMSEATAGRFLRQMDEQGYTETLTKRGRILTSCGYQRLDELRLRKKTSLYSEKVTRAARPEGREDLIELLYFRRAIESQAAWLAATRATEEEIKQLHHSAHTHLHCAESDHRGQAAQNFHVLVGKASHNRMISVMVELFYEPGYGSLSMLLDRSLAGNLKLIAQDHLQLAKVIEERNAQQAEAIMREHFDKFIDAVSRAR